MSTEPTFSNPHIVFSQGPPKEGALAPVETLTTTTDTKELAEAALTGGEEAARGKPSPDVKTERSKNGRTVTSSYEPEDSSRARYLEALEKELEEMGETATTEQEAPAEVEQPQTKDAELMQRVTEQAAQDGIEAARQQFYQQLQAQHLANPQTVAPPEVQLQQFRAAAVQDFRQRVEALGLTEKVEKLANVPLPAEVLDAMVTLEGGEKAAGHLADHPEKVAELARLPGSVGAARFALLAARMTTAKPQPIRTARPPLVPIKPVRGSAMTSKPSLGELPYREYANLRNQQEKNRYRR